jgi:hypothetical protein
MDGYGDPSITVSGQVQPDQYVANGQDCNDNDSAINPGVTEVLDSIDNDCDGLIDNVPYWYADTDLDSYGDPAVSLQQPLKPDGYVADNTDCNDTNGAINPAATEVLDSIDNDCDGLIDNVPYWYADTDLDGYGDPAVSLQQALKPDGYVADNTDCNDTNADIHPGAVEIVGDEIDSNCNGLLDDVSVGDTGPAGGTVFYVDQTYALEAAPADFARKENWGCFNTLIPGSSASSIGTGAQNTADMLAAGCSIPAEAVANYTSGGFDDWYMPSRFELSALFAARDIVGNFSPYIGRSFPVCYWSSSQYSDYRAWSVNWYTSAAWAVGQHLNLNKDASCHVRAVRTIPFVWYADTDLDGYGDPSVSIQQIAKPDGYVADNTDCNDTNSAINPGTTEVIDGIDNNCDGRIDALYFIGDQGPAGGIVFYVDEANQHGMEAAPVSLRGVSFAEWGCSGTNITGAAGTGIGTGLQNTSDILAAGCVPETNDVIAADLVASYTLNGFADWFLPSRDELGALYAIKSLLSGSNHSIYWSSSESDDQYSNIWVQCFSAVSGICSEGEQRLAGKGSTLGVRPVRVF